MIRHIILLTLLLTSVFSGFAISSTNEAGCLSTGKEVALDFPPLFQSVMDESIDRMAQVIKAPLEVPIPKDMGGGYTHERHKQNYRELQTAGQLYKLTGEVKYAEYIKSMFMAYAKIYKGLPIHPTDRSYATGKIFWQCLNDANWMVYSSKAYASIYDYLTEEERNHIEQEFLLPYADYISVDSPQFFNRVHNHSTWGNAAVGMVGLATRNKELVQRALYGLDLGEVDKLAKDNDGGFIYEGGKPKAGFFAQIDYSFSPDGYYGEGPYYQRYAMLPFMIFAQALDDEMPELKIFEYRDGILIKAVEAMLQQTTQSDEFFPINDAQKGMNIHPNSVVTAVDIAYGFSKQLVFLSAAQKQNTILLTDQGLEVAKALVTFDDNSYAKQSINLRDGNDGCEGGLAILRSDSGDRQTTAILKYTAQGLGHGHYDKLGLLVYDGDTEVLQDYGAARWVNIDQKAGGRYLKENKTWAKQTIAHNTVTIDQTSHFGGVYEVANANHSDLVFYNDRQADVQIAAATDSNAYADVTMDRMVVLWSNEAFLQPVTIDFMDIRSDTGHSYDMPYQYAGQIMSQSFDYTIMSPPLILGEAHGYQHLYKEAAAILSESSMQMNWMKDQRFYTLTSIAKQGDEVILARIGANDPEFNLRRDALMIHRVPKSKATTFLSVIENHGTYSPVTEVPINPYSTIASVKMTSNDDNYLGFDIVAKDERIWKFMIDKKTGETNIKQQ